MLKRYFEKNINGKLIIYDKYLDVIKFSYDEVVTDNYSKVRLAEVAYYKTDISIVDKCNQHCINCFTNCYPSKPHSEMSYNNLLHKVKEKERDIIRLVITGGEPFMHSDIDQILKLPSLFPELKFVICSNGTNILDSHIVWLSYFDWLTILSIHGSPETHNNYTRSKFFLNTKHALERLSKVARVKIYSVINEYTTKSDINYIMKLKEDFNIGAIKFMTPRGSNRCSKKPDESIIDYVKSCLDGESGLQEISSKTRLIAVDGQEKTTD